MSAPSGVIANIALAYCTAHLIHCCTRRKALSVSTSCHPFATITGGRGVAGRELSGGA